MSFPNHKADYISEQDYLEREEISEFKNEYFDGEIFAMSGASRNHQILISRIVQKFSNHFKQLPKGDTPRTKG